jgi:hypothetical protein
MYRRAALSALGYGPRRLFTDTVRAMRKHRAAWDTPIPSPEEEEDADS